MPGSTCLSVQPFPGTIMALRPPLRSTGWSRLHDRRRKAALPHAHQVHDEHERRPGLDDAARAAVAVGLVRGDGQPAAAADLHPGDALVPALDDHADAQPELQGVAAVPRRVELLAT